MSARVLMPRGIYRGCTLGCGYRAFTVHTGKIPCSTPGCEGHLEWPGVWPHVCPSGHGAQVRVLLPSSESPDPVVPMTDCAVCAEDQKAKRR